MKKKILVIEDEEKIARVLTLELNHEGYETAVEYRGDIGLIRAESGEYDLILLDVMLPGLNGIEVLRRFRKSDVDTPVILLTARDAVPDKVNGLDQGANDYLTKPFDIEELLARIRVALRGKEEGQSKSESLNVGSLHVDLGTRDISRNGNIIELTSKEFNLLVYLLKNKNLVLTREQIISAVWGYEFMGDTNVVDVYIRYLRKKIDQGYEPPLIHTHRGVGYSIKEPVK